MSETNADYYIPHGSHWPIVGSIGVTILLGGFATLLNGGGGMGGALMLVGFVVTLIMVFGWFGVVIRESEAGTYNTQVDRSFRQGMMWFILSEVMFFAAFFGALFYARVLSVPWLLGMDSGAVTHMLLWPEFTQAWPTNGPEAQGGVFGLVSAWGVPAINTLLLLSSGVTITLAHWALKANDRTKLILWMWVTVLLGVTFLGFQAYEYYHAHHALNLTLDSGIYGATFYMLTGFHGFHVTLGVTMLIVITLRCMKGHFTPDKHFGWEAVAWYWHFVDVVWLGLFIFVYVL